MAVENILRDIEERERAELTALNDDRLKIEKIAGFLNSGKGTPSQRAELSIGLAVLRNTPHIKKYGEHVLERECSGGIEKRIVCSGYRGFDPIYSEQAIYDSVDTIEVDNGPVMTKSRGGPGKVYYRVPGGPSVDVDVDVVSVPLKNSGGGGVALPIFGALVIAAAGLFAIKSCGSSSAIEKTFSLESRASQTTVQTYRPLDMGLIKKKNGTGSNIGETIRNNLSKDSVWIGDYSFSDTPANIMQFYRENPGLFGASSIEKIFKIDTSDESIYRKGTGHVKVLDISPYGGIYTHGWFLRGKNKESGEEKEYIYSPRFLICDSEEEAIKTERVWWGFYSNDKIGESMEKRRKDDAYELRLMGLKFDESIVFPYNGYEGKHPIKEITLKFLARPMPHKDRSEPREF
ncbi:MAG: hypothetical protein Q7S74_00695 [Nanoarchaeota archaeon]|nr:hypothetical protein [Nanoarchaeota archaeon]